MALSFNHLLAKVVIQFKNEFSVEDVTLNVANLKLKGIAKTADLDLTTCTWATPTDKSLVLEPGFPNNANKNRPNEVDTLIAAKKFANTEHFYLIPEDINAEAYRLNFDVTVWQGEEGKQIKIGEYKHSVAFDKMQFKMGKQYRVLAKLNSSNVNPEAEIQPINLTISVTPWGEPIEGDVDFGK